MIGYVSQENSTVIHKIRFKLDRSIKMPNEKITCQIVHSDKFKADDEKHKDANQLAKADEFSDKQKEEEEVCNLITTKLYAVC